MRRLPYYKATLVSSSLWIAFLWTTSCQRRQAHVPLSAPPAPSAHRPVPAPEPLPAPPAINTPAPSPANAPTVQAQEPLPPYQVNKPPQNAAKKPVRSAASSTAAQPAPSPAATPPVAVPVAPPKLGDVLTEDQEKQYSASIDQSLSRAEASLNALGGRQLNKDQQAEVEQIRSFIQQAKAARTSDASGAKSLAERAEVLARDLAASFK